jgi:hypothetical protein
MSTRIIVHCRTVSAKPAATTMHRAVQSTATSCTVPCANPLAAKRIWGCIEVLLHTCLPLAAMRHHHNLKIVVSGQHRLIWGIIIYFHRSETTSGSEHNFAQVHTVPLAANKCARVGF